MPFKLTLSTEVICALITLAGVIYANISSKVIAKETANNEMNKLKQTWEHDNEIAFERAFCDMTEAVSTYIIEPSQPNQQIARTKTSVMLAHATGDMANRVQNLYDSMKRRPSPEAEEMLTEVLKCRRQMRLEEEKKRKKFIFF